MDLNSLTYVNWSLLLLNGEHSSLHSPMEGFTCVDGANVSKCNLQSIYRIV